MVRRGAIKKVQQSTLASPPHSPPAHRTRACTSVLPPLNQEKTLEMRADSTQTGITEPKQKTCSPTDLSSSSPCELCEQWVTVTGKPRRRSSTASDDTSSKSSSQHPAPSQDGKPKGSKSKDSKPNSKRVVNATASLGPKSNSALNLKAAASNSCRDTRSPAPSSEGEPRANEKRPQVVAHKSGTKSNVGQANTSSSPKPVLFISRHLERDMIKLNRDFENLHNPGRFMCETTRQGIKITFACLSDRMHYEQALQENEVSYSLGKDAIRTEKYVIKGYDHRVNCEEIKSLLVANSYPVIKVVNMTSFKTKKPLPMHLVELKASPRNRDIITYDSLDHFKVKIEKYRRSRVPPQCSNCQEYFHMAGRCRAPARCRICSGSHQTNSCSQTAEKKCSLCQGGHTSNYKGCPAYKDLMKARRNNQKRTNPPLTVTASSNATSAPREASNDAKSYAAACSTQAKTAKKSVGQKMETTRAETLYNQVSRPEKHSVATQVEETELCKQKKKCSRSTGTQTEASYASVVKSQRSSDMQTEARCLCGYNCPRYEFKSVLHDMAEVLRSGPPNLKEELKHYIDQLYTRYQADHK